MIPIKGEYDFYQKDEKILRGIKKVKDFVLKERAFDINQID